MSADPAALAAYRKALSITGQTVTFRRVSGQAPAVTTLDVSVTAIFRNYAPSAPVGVKAGAITAGQREFIVMAADLDAAGFPLPLKKNDKIILAGEAFNISEVDPGKRVFAGAIEGKAEGV